MALPSPLLPPPAATALTTRLSPFEKSAYGLGDFASCIYWTTFSSYLFIFYTDVFGLHPAAVGSLLLWSRVFDGINDPLIGMLADRTKTRWGSFRPYLLWCAGPFAIAGVLCFTTPDISAAGRVIWAWVTYNFLMVMYTAINIPYNSMLGVLTPDSVERTSVSSYKFVFACSAGLFVNATLPFLTRALGNDGADLQKGYQLTFLLYGLVAVICFLLSFKFTRERVRPTQARATPLRQDLRDLVTNGPWLSLVGVTVTFILAVSTRGTITAHYVKYFIGVQTVDLPLLGLRTFNYEMIVSLFMTLGAGGAVVGIFFVTPMVRRMGKKAALISMLGLSAVTTFGFYFLEPDQLLHAFILQAIGSLTGGAMAVLLWAMFADTADYGDWKHGRRATGLIFSASGTAQKFSWAACGWGAGQMLALTGFVANLPDQNPDVLSGLRHMMSTVPGLFTIAAMIAVSLFPLNEKRMTEITRDLEARRGRNPV